MSLTIDSVDLPTGARLPYVEHGDPAGTPVIMLHGYSDSSHSFSLMQPRLPDWMHSYALTVRGHGDASKPESGYTLDDFSADVLAFMDTLGIESAVIVGHSNGGYIGQRFATDHPERTRALVLISTFRGFGDNPAVGELSRVVMGLSDPVDREFIREFQASTAHQPLPADFFQTVLDESAKMPARVWKAIFRDVIQRATPPLDTGSIDIPTLVVGGEHDSFATVAEQERLAADISGAETLVYIDTAHCPHWERPGRVAADVAAFVERIVSA